MNRTMKRVAVPVGAAVLLGTSGFAFMALNVVPTTYAGDGTGAINGYNVSDVHYGTYGGQVADVSFRLDQGASPGNVEAHVSNADGSFTAVYDICTQAATGVWRCNNDTASISIEDAESLRVIAAQ